MKQVQHKYTLLSLLGSGLEAIIVICVFVCVCICPQLISYTTGIIRPVFIVDLYDDMLRASQLWARNSVQCHTF